MKHTMLAALFMLSAACGSENIVAPREEQLITPSFAFDEFGYNDVANIFVGLADGVDRIPDGNLWGDPTYANDHLVMKWNKTWEQCNANRTPENCAGAWLTNEWNGQTIGGSGESWHYKFVWVGACGPDRTPTFDGGYCIWGEYKVLMSQGTAGDHFWDAHAKPNGFGLAP